MKEYYLKKADENLPEILHEQVAPQISFKALFSGDEIVIDLGNHYVGYFSFKMWYVDEYIDAPVTLNVRFCETKSELEEDYSVYRGWLCRSWLQDDTVKIDFPGVYSMPRRYAARYVKIRVLDTPKKLSLSEFVFDAVTSANIENLIPAEILDSELNAIDRVALNTLKNCMQRVFEDGPKRDRRLWIGDLRLEALANYYTFGGTSLVKRCLYLFAAASKNSLGFIPGYVYENPVYVSGTWHIVDCNHANSGKKYKEQVRIAKEVLHSCALNSDIAKIFKGFMIESYIEEGCQKIGEGIYGKSITDPCLGWEDTEKFIYYMAEKL